MVHRFIPFVLICLLGCTGSPGKTKLVPVIDSEWWRICDMPDLGDWQEIKLARLKWIKD